MSSSKSTTHIRFVAQDGQPLRLSDTSDAFAKSLLRGLKLSKNEIDFLEDSRDAEVAKLRHRMDVRQVLHVIKSIDNLPPRTTTRTERRDCSAPAASPLSVRAARGAGGDTISGYAAVFYRATDPGSEYELSKGVLERIAPGAFGDFGDVIAPFNHDPSQLLGRLSSGTLRLSVDSRGLKYEIDIDDQSSVGRNVLAFIRRRDVNGSSFAFATLDESWHREGRNAIRVLNRVTLYDVGPVVTPAYQGTSATTG